MSSPFQSSITAYAYRNTGFDYHFNAIHDGSNELFMAYKDMFEIAISQQKGSLWDIAVLYFPALDGLWVSSGSFLCTHRSLLAILARRPLPSRSKVARSHQPRGGSSYPGEEN